MRPAGRWRRAVTEPFAADSGVCWPVVAVFLVINGLVLLNALLHDPRIGYDARAYLSYIEALSEWRMVTPEDSWEYFSPPLPFLFPALLISLTRVEVFAAARWAQMLNVLLSIGLTFFLLRLCLLLGTSPALRLGTLAFLGVMPVYYKTFAMVRGEPFVAFSCVVAVYFAARVFAKNGPPFPNAVWMGAALGLGASSRQWGVLVIPAVLGFGALQWVRRVEARHRLGIALALGVTITFVTGSWFYLILHSVHGTMTQFNREPAPSFALTNQPPEFYYDLGLDQLFTYPIRPNFLNQLFPVLYADFWGDYWAYFIVYGVDTRGPVFLAGKDLVNPASESPQPEWLETNYDETGSLLGRVNLVGLFPSALGLIALAVALAGLFRDPDIERRDITALLLFVIVASLVGYVWFLIRYPSPDLGDTLKASYMLQVYPLAAVLVGVLLFRIGVRSRAAYGALMAGLGIVFLHNLPVMITSFRLPGLS